MTALQDEDTRKKGVVIVLLNVGSRRYFFDNLNIMKYSQRFSLSMPHYISALHYVYDDILLYPLVTFSRFLLGSRVRGRFLPHLVRKYCVVTTKLEVGIGIEFRTHATSQPLLSHTNLPILFLTLDISFR